MSTNFQMIMLKLGTDYIGRKKTGIALAKRNHLGESDLPNRSILSVAYISPLNK